jgi:hypothetical protein
MNMRRLWLWSMTAAEWAKHYLSHAEPRKLKFDTLPERKSLISLETRSKA